MTNKHTVIDHITVTAPTLEAGAKLVENSLGVTPQTGGEHPKMGTHNLFLRLGKSCFLEVIASNPKAKKPDRPRWFALDDIDKNTLAQLKTWVIRTNDIASTLKDSSEPLGEIVPMSRGETHWQITIPDDGSLPLQEGAPALIQWDQEPHPASHFKDYGLSLSKLKIYHSAPEKLQNLLHSIKLKEDIEVEIVKGEKTKMVAFIKTPEGIRELSI